MANKPTGVRGAVAAATAEQAQTETPKTARRAAKFAGATATALSGNLTMMRDYGFTSTEQVYYAARVLGPDFAKQVFNTTSLQLQAQLAGAMNLLSAAQSKKLQELPCALGVPKNVTPPTGMTPEHSPVPTPPPAATVNHIPDMPAIRDQNPRGTCVAHGTLAVVEHAIKMEGGGLVDLSEQFLYWNCKQNDGHPDQEGTWCAVSFPLIDRDGCCQETTWPYQRAGCANEACGPPPPGAIADALPYRRKVQALPATSVADIKAALAGGKCVAFSIPVYRSWYHSDWTRHTGEITMPLPADVLEGGHCMCLVGYVDQPGEPGVDGGRFILRNSWNTDWAAQCPYGPGYGTIPYAYVARYCWEAYTVA